MVGYRNGNSSSTAGRTSQLWDVWTEYVIDVIIGERDTKTFLGQIPNSGADKHDKRKEREALQCTEG